jgi:AAA family ATP:ADP antiporter
MINAIVLWWAFHVHWKPIPVVYYMWVNVFGIILTAQVWTIATSVLTTEQARRLFPLLCSGGVLGSLLGGVLAAAGVRHFGTGDLILAPVILLGFCVPIVRTLARHYAVKREEILEPVEVDEPSPGIGSALRVTMQTRYLRLIACLLSVSAIVTLLVDFQFKVIIQSYFRSTDAMTEFFGQFYACVGLASFAFQLVAGAKFFERYGLRIALMSLPLTLLGGTAALIVFPSLVWTGIFLKGSDGVLRSSIDKSTMEMLYIPIPLSVKVHVKAVIDMLVQRFSDGVGGVLLLFLTQALGLGLTGIGVFNVGLLLAWIWIARQTRREYSVAMRGHAGPSQSKAA